MTDPSFEELRDELRELVVVTRHGEPTQQQIERLDELVRSDPEARDLYVQLIDDEMSLQLLAGGPEMPTEVPLQSANHGVCLAAMERNGCNHSGLGSHNRPGPARGFSKT